MPTGALSITFLPFMVTEYMGEPSAVSSVVTTILPEGLVITAAEAPKDATSDKANIGSFIF